uniref:Uncharacterized protein n=1 Tax=Arundo donax TaxID=35708 RepID=A0A0A9CKG7_ARUDO
MASRLTTSAALK